MIEGKKQFAFAWLERQSRYNLADVSLKATKEGAGWSLSGHKGVVYNAASADHIIVLARTAGSAREPKGLTLFVVDGKAKGLTRRDYPTQDALRASELTFDKVSVGADAVLGKVDDGFAHASRTASTAPSWRSAPRRPAAWTRSTPRRWNTSRRASSSACRSASSRCCSIAWSTASPTPRKRAR